MDREVVEIFSDGACRGNPGPGGWRSEEHTSELQSRSDLVCRLLLEKKKKKQIQIQHKIKKRTNQISLEDGKCNTLGPDNAEDGNSNGCVGRYIRAVEIV